MIRYLCLFFILTLVSCASSQYIVSEVESSKLDGQKITYLRGGKLKLFIAPFDDVRKVQDRIGQVSTGIGNIATPVQLEKKDLGDYTTRFFTKGMINRGMQMAKESEADFVLKAKIGDLWLREVATEFGTEAIECSASIDYTLLNAKDQKMAWNGKMSLSYRHAGKAFDTTVVTSEALGACVNQLLERLITLKKFQSLLGIEVVK